MAGGDEACAGVALPLGVPPHVGSPYGLRTTRSGTDFHGGLDLHAPEGSSVHAILPGRVVARLRSGEYEGYGNAVVLQHGPQLFSLSAHMQGFSRAVLQGAELAAGVRLGTVGRTAGTRARPSKTFESSKPHLHLEFLTQWPPPKAGGGRLDPAAVLAQIGIVVPGKGPLLLRCVPEDLPQGRGRARFRPKASSSGSAGLLLLGLYLWSRQN